ncbi:MAG TPA: hypothetical protein VGX46_06075 [Vicinamibacterales bacterium]|nr:hypothetical protein [Vicinamibacterales bacterium]
MIRLSKGLRVREFERERRRVDPLEETATAADGHRGSVFALLRFMVFSKLLPTGVTMPLRKTAIAVSDDLLAAVDHAARQRHESRNRFVTRVLQYAVRARRDAEITRRLNELFSSSEVRDHQRREAAELDVMGASWTDERW